MSPNSTLQDIIHMKTITWLHFSDIHIGNPKSEWEYEKIKDKFITDLKKMRNDNGLQPDLIFFTGDAVFGHLGSGGGRSMSDQYDEVEKVFSAVREVYDPSVPKENFFIVPGNHDTNISTINEFADKAYFESINSKDYETATKELSSTINSKNIPWNDYQRRLHDYCLFLEKHAYSHLLGVCRTYSFNSMAI